MTCDRGYRSALSAEEAAEELRANAGTQFDADVVDALLAVVFDADRSRRIALKSGAPGADR